VVVEYFQFLLLCVLNCLFLSLLLKIDACDAHDIGRSHGSVARRPRRRSASACKLTNLPNNKQQTTTTNKQPNKQLIHSYIQLLVCACTRSSGSSRRFTVASCRVAQRRCCANDYRTAARCCGMLYCVFCIVNDCFCCVVHACNTMCRARLLMIAS
jgi:hypothetical protein